MRQGAALTKASFALEEFRPAADRIVEVQRRDGAIPWFEEGAWDPWNHVECAMALVTMGEVAAAEGAFEYLCQTQRDDGAWLGEYGNALPMVDRDFISREKAEALVDSNFCAYPAVGVAHYLWVTRDFVRAREWWPMVRRALDFVLTLRRPDGSIAWSLEAVGTDQDDALLAGNASIAKSFECGVYLAGELGEPCVRWRAAHGALVNALQTRPEVFDQRGAGARFAMDWYYPALAGTLTKAQARQRIAQKWPDFVDDGRGCRCVLDEPWVTIAESAELVMALLVIGDTERARDLFEALLRYRDDAGVFWMGWQTQEAIVWPREQPSWTQAAVILAAEALLTADRGGSVLTRCARSTAASKSASS
ncbi:MAG: prenyltransferase [Pseudomonadota bacterium]